MQKQVDVYCILREINGFLSLTGLLGSSGVMAFPLTGLM